MRTYFVHHVDNSLKHLSLCTGYGGIDLGFKRVFPNVRTITYVEIEAFAVVNLVEKIEKGWLDPAPIWSNLKTFPWAEFRGKVDILSGGFPCQPFSTAGRKQGVDDERHLFPYITEGIRALGRPPIVFFENVEGIISTKIGDQSVLHHVLIELEKLGYRATAGIFSASEVGGSHQRKRVFILGTTLQKYPELSPCGRAIGHPAKRGVSQFEWEPPRTVGDSDKQGLEGQVPQGESRKESEASPPRSSASRNIQGQIESKVGGNLDGDSDRVDITELYTSCSNRTDELRLLGNGVVPATAEVAFRTLWQELGDSSCRDGKRAERRGDPTKKEHQYRIENQVREPCGKNWATPLSSDHKKRGPNSKQQGLPNEVLNWATPQTRDWKGSSDRSLKGLESDLPTQVEKK